MPKRVSFEFPDRSHDRLLRLKEKTETTNYADVVRNALRLYEWMIDQVENGGEVSVKDVEGVVSKVPVFLD